jgi:hypothetical protein
MNMNVTYKSTLFFLTIGIAILLFLQFKGCEQTYTSHSYSQEYVDSLRCESSELLDEVFVLHNDIAMLDSIIYHKKDRVIKGRETIKILEKSVVIHDTIVITYVEALNWQIKELDTIIDIQDKKIDKQAQIIDKQDSIIVNSNKVIALIESDNENLQKEIKKKDKKIKILKIERILYPAAILFGGIVLILEK